MAFLGRVERVVEPLALTIRPNMPMKRR